MSCSAPRQRSILLQLCQQSRLFRAREHSLLPVLRAGCRPAGGLHSLLKLHLAWLVEKWLDGARCLLDFPAHWLDPPGADPEPAAVPSESGDLQRKRLRKMLHDHRFLLVPTLLAVAASGPASRDGGSGFARQQLERAGRLLQRKESEMLRDSIPHLIGRWLPAKFGAPQQPPAQRWAAIVKLIESLRDDGEEVPLRVRIEKSLDHILQCMLALESVTWVIPGSGELVVGTLVKSLAFLADQVS